MPGRNRHSPKAKTIASLVLLIIIFTYNSVTAKEATQKQRAQIAIDKTRKSVRTSIGKCALNGKMATKQHESLDV
jgi:hypothetical protein